MAKLTVKEVIWYLAEDLMSPTKMLASSIQELDNGMPINEEKQTSRVTKATKEAIEKYNKRNSHIGESLKHPYDRVIKISKKGTIFSEYNGEIEGMLLGFVLGNIFYVVNPQIDIITLKENIKEIKKQEKDAQLEKNFYL